LLEAGADASLRVSLGETAIFRAAASSEPESVRLLLEVGSAIDPAEGSLWETTPLATAAAYGQLENVRLLLDAGADLNPSSDQGPLYRAVENGHDGVARLLIESGAATADAVEPLLWAAAEKNLTQIGQMLLESGADPNRSLERGWGWTPLRRAVTRSNFELVRMLLAAGADPFIVDKQGETVLFRIDWEEAPPAMIESLLNLGINVDRQSEQGNTVLMQSVFWRREQAVRRLLEAGADPLITNAAGHSALNYAEGRLPYRSGIIRFDGSEVNAEIVRLLRKASLRDLREDAAELGVDRDS